MRLLEQTTLPFQECPAQEVSMLSSTYTRIVGAQIGFGLTLSGCGHP